MCPDIGFKYLCAAQVLTDTTTADPTYAAGKNIGKAISANLAVTNAEGELYADNELAEHVTRFASGALTMEVDQMSLEDQALIYGATYEDNKLKLSKNDQAPFMGYAGYQELIQDNVSTFRAWHVKKAKASVPDMANATQANSVAFGKQPIKARVMTPKHGHWYEVEDFTTEAAAQAYVDSVLNVAAWHRIEVQLQGEASGKTIDKEGVFYVAAGEDFVLTVTGTPAALYDNKTESKASIAAGVYTLTAVAAEHRIAVIFS